MLIEPIPKPKRIKNKKAIEEARRDYCEYCGGHFNLQVHHWQHTRGAGGNDEPSNLVTLCMSCHAKAHTGQISKTMIAKIKGVEL